MFGVNSNIIPSYTYTDVSARRPLGCFSWPLIIKPLVPKTWIRAMGRKRYLDLVAMSYDKRSMIQWNASICLVNAPVDGNGIAKSTLYSFCSSRLAPNVVFALCNSIFGEVDECAGCKIHQERAFGWDATATRSCGDKPDMDSKD